MVCPFSGMEFDALEAMQCMLERRKGGETGVKAVQLLERRRCLGGWRIRTLVKGTAELGLFPQRRAAGRDHH